MEFGEDCGNFFAMIIKFQIFQNGEKCSFSSHHFCYTVIKLLVSYSGDLDRKLRHGNTVSPGPQGC